MTRCVALALAACGIIESNRLLRALEPAVADKQSATLAAEEILKPERPHGDGLSLGSPWLWAALALVVGVLLVVVARMLPKPPAS